MTPYWPVLNACLLGNTRSDRNHLSALNNKKVVTDKKASEPPKLDSAEAYNSRGISWNEKENFDKAIADFNDAIRLNPKLALAYNNRGNTWEKKGDKAKAEADFKKARGLGFSP